MTRAGTSVLFAAALAMAASSAVGEDDSREAMKLVAPEAAAAEADAAEASAADPNAADADAADADAATPELLTIGSQAPALNIEHWIHDGDGQFEHVTELQAGKVYVVEFWATWCGPCIQAMPHIVETQQAYADRGVQVISISDEPVETVEGFLDRPAARPQAAAGESTTAADASADASDADEETKSEATDADAAADDDDAEPYTYRDLTSGYCLTTDPDGSSHAAYFEAARQQGIPCSFLVGKTGVVEWIGHPMALDEPLAAVVADSWDRDAFAAEFVPEQKFRIAIENALKPARDNDFAEVLKRITKLQGTAPSPQDERRLASMIKQVRAAIFRQLIETDLAAAATRFEELVAEAEGDGETLYALARQVQPLAASTDEATVAFVDKAVAALGAASSGEGIGPLLPYAMARTLIDRGDLEGAIRYQTQAVERSSGRMQRAFKQMLDRMLEKQAAAAKSDDAKSDDAKSDAANSDDGPADDAPADDGPAGEGTAGEGTADEASADDAAAEEPAAAAPAASGV